MLRAFILLDSLSLDRLYSSFVRVECDVTIHLTKRWCCPLALTYIDGKCQLCLDYSSSETDVGHCMKCRSGGSVA